MEVDKIVDLRALIGERLKKAREAAGLSQRKLGLLTGLSDKTISAYEQGRVTPPLETLVRIAKQLGKPISYFLGEDNPSERLASRLYKLQQVLAHVEEVLNQVKEELLRCMTTIGKGENA